MQEHPVGKTSSLKSLRRQSVQGDLHSRIDCSDCRSSRTAAQPEPQFINDMRKKKRRVTKPRPSIAGYNRDEEAIAVTGTLQSEVDNSSFDLTPPNNQPAARKPQTTGNSSEHDQTHLLMLLRLDRLSNDSSDSENME